MKQDGDVAMKQDGVVDMKLDGVVKQDGVDGVPVLP